METGGRVSAAGSICDSGGESSAVFAGRDIYGGSGDCGSDRPGAWEWGRVCFLAADPALSYREKPGGASAGFTGIFPDVLEFSQDHSGDSGGTAYFWHAGGMGTGEIFFPGKKNDLYDLYHYDDDALSGDDAVAISGP